MKEDPVPVPTPLLPLPLAFPPLPELLLPPLPAVFLIWMNVYGNDAVLSSLSDACEQLATINTAKKIARAKSLIPITSPFFLACFVKSILETRVFLAGKVSMCVVCVYTTAKQPDFRQRRPSTAECGLFT